jgi:hypothetical protein
MAFFEDLRDVQKQAKDMTPPERQRKAQHLAVNGRPGTATITALRQTGTFVNENPEIEMDLEVSIDGTQPYPATHRQIIAMIAAPQFQPGATVPVRVDPANPVSLIVA